MPGVRLRLVGETRAFESPQHLLSAADLAATPWYNGGAGGASVDRDATVRVSTGLLSLSEGAKVSLQRLEPPTISPWSPCCPLRSPRDLPR